MEKEKKNYKKYFKSIILILIPISIAILIILMGSMYYVFKDDIDELAGAQKEYYDSLEVTSNGIQKVSSNIRLEPLQTVVLANNTNRYNSIIQRQAISSLNYNLNFAKIASTEGIIFAEADINESEQTAKSLAEEIASKVNCLEKYINDSASETKEEKLAYLMNAEIVTRFPYIKDIDGDETKLNGIIKFYRCLNLIEHDKDVTDKTSLETVELTFIEPKEFLLKLEEYKISGNKEVFKYFTIDENQNVIVAYGTATTKTITTTDKELTLDTINEMSTVTYSEKEEGVYLYNEYTVSTKKIDYQSLTEQYVLPFNLLATLLVQTRDYELVKEIADLAYESKIAIGIYDNKTVTENTDEYTYNKKIKYTQNTELVLDKINTDPEVDISSSQYSEVVKECLGKLNDTRENSIHCSGIEQEDLETATGNRADGNVYEAYISEISADGTISEITTDAHEFKTTFNIKKVSNSVPTVDIDRADIWAGKYTSTYTPEQYNDPTEPASSHSLDDEEFANIDVNKFEKELLKEDGAIGKNLKAHSENLKGLAIEKIIEKTDFTVSPRNMTINDILTHANTCDECKEELETKYGTSWSEEIADNQNVLNEVKTLEELATVKLHIEEILQNEAAEETEERKQKFITDINRQITYNQWPTSYKANVSIQESSASSKISSTYKKDLAGMEDSGKKFSKILNKEKFRETKEAILAREGWFWESIREHDGTAKLEDLIRYMFNIAFNTEHFGTFSEADIEKLFKVFEPTKQMETITSYSGMNLLQQYVRMFENSYIFDYVYGTSDNYTDLVAQYITEDKSAYYVRSDGHDHPTVGFGVDLFNGAFYDESLGREITFATYLIDFYGYTETQLRDMEGNTTIPADIVDELEEKELQEKLDDVMEMNEQENLGLKKYQIYALTSFNFNTGKMYKWGSYDNFIELYRQCWDDEEDDRYGENTVDYDQTLYTDFFYKSRYSNGEEVPGLITRRESEWTLFQTGYMDNINKWVTDQNYPEGIRIFKVASYTFPEYPQKRKVGDVTLYANERFGYPEADRTLGSSGCGVFSMSMILSGLLGDATIDPITYRDAMEQDERIGYSYHSWNPSTKDSNGSDWTVLCNEDFLNEIYGVQVEETWVDYNAGIEALNEGKCILAIEPGHYVAVIPVPDELQGQGYEFFVLDSARGHTGAYKSKSDFIAKTGYDSLEFLAIIAP